jgi:hypothetical protein
MKRYILTVLFLFSLVSIAKAKNTGNYGVRPATGTAIDIGTSVGIGITNYKLDRSDIAGYSFGINKSFLSGNTKSCGLGGFICGPQYCFESFGNKIPHVRYKASNIMFLNFGVQLDNKLELGLLLGSDSYKPDKYLPVLKEKRIMLGFYLKRYFPNNIGIKLGLLSSSVDQVSGYSETHEVIIDNIIDKNGKIASFKYYRVDFTIGYRFL